MSDTGTISQELINKVAEELATLKAERDELRKFVEDLLGHHQQAWWHFRL